MSSISIYFPAFFGPGPSGTEPESWVISSISIYFEDKPKEKAGIKYIL